MFLFHLVEFLLVEEEWDLKTKEGGGSKLFGRWNEFNLISGCSYANNILLHVEYSAPGGGESLVMSAFLAPVGFL